MEKILERYERYSYAEGQLVHHDPQSSRNLALEYTKLKARVELLQRNHRQYLGEDLDTLSLKDIQSLEQQLESALKLVRSRKNHLMYDSISELQRKEKALEEQNTSLKKKIYDKEKNLADQGYWDQQNNCPSSSSFLLPQPFPCLNTGGTYQGDGLEERRNDLDLTLEPLLSCHLRGFAA